MPKWHTLQKSLARHFRSHPTPHFHLTRRTTVPASGPAVKFVDELECKRPDSFGFSLPYAPLTPKLNKVATPP